MEKTIILNGSPRAPKSNSKRYAEIFSACHGADVEYYNITRTNHDELRRKIGTCSDVVLVFPLYADALPVGLLNFLKALELEPPASKPVVSVMINCGFLEYRQNDLAVRMMKFFCKRNGYAFGSVVEIGSGEAILDTPFRFLAKRAIRDFSRSIRNRKYAAFHTTMPLTKRLFILASTLYWSSYGKKYGVTREEMRTMRIEGEKTV